MARLSRQALRPPLWSRRSRGEEREARRLELVLRRAEDLLAAPGKRKKKEILRVLAGLPEGALLDPVYHLRAGDCFRELGRLGEAEAHYRAALDRDTHSADALYGLGLVYLAKDEHEEAVEAFLAVRALDLSRPPFPWSLPADDFVAAAEAAFEELPLLNRARLEHLPIVAADYPTEALIEDGVDPRTLGLITGVPYSEKLGFGGGGGVDCVQLYQRNIERICISREEVLEEIRITVLHETGHYFGLSDEELDRIGLG